MKKLILSLLLVMVSAGGALTLVQPVLAAATTYECPADSVRAKTGGTTNVKNLAECNVRETTGNDELFHRINLIVNVVAGVMGTVVTAMIVVGGVQFATSQGDAAKTTKARNTILYGVIGAVVVMLAFAITKFVLNNVFGG